MKNRRLAPEAKSVENTKQHHEEEKEENNSTEESQTESESEDEEFQIKEFEEGHFQHKIPKSPDRNKVDDFDPSDLLRQVEELEKCFTKSRTDLSRVAATSMNDDSSSTASGAGSPHLTLEFPSGSSIRENPLFKREFLLRKTNQKQQQDVGEGIKSPERAPDTCTGKKYHQDDNEDDGPTDEQSIIESIQKVNNTLSEISREIELSSRLSGEVRRNSSGEPCVEHGEGSESEVEVAISEPCYASNEEKRITTDEVFCILHKDDLITTVDKKASTDDNNEFLNSEKIVVVDGCLGDAATSTSFHNDVIENDDVSDLTSESSDRADPNTVMRDWLSNIKPPPSPASAAVIDNIERISKHGEIVKQCEESSTPSPSLPSKSKRRDHRANTRNAESSLSSSEIPTQIVTSPTSTIVTQHRDTPTHDDLFEKIDELIRFERRDSENTICLNSNRSTSSRGSNSNGTTNDNNNDTNIIINNNNNNNIAVKIKTSSSSYRDRLDSGLQSVSSDSGSSPYPSPNVTRAAASIPSPAATAFYQRSTIRRELRRVASASTATELENDHVFHRDNDSDFSEWSPVSTLASGRSCSSMSQRPRSHSVTYAVRDSSQIHSSNRGHARTLSPPSHNKRGVPGKSQGSSHEMAAIEKFFKMTNTFLDKDGSAVHNDVSSTLSLENVS